VRILVTGATGFVGSRLVPELVQRDHDVRAMTRRPDAYDGPGRGVGGDVADPASLRDALAGCDAAYYLVHSLDSPDFSRRDAKAAIGFADAAAAAGVQQLVYLGGLGSDDDTLSEHLRSRREVEALLGVGGVPVTTLRAGIVIGAGSLAWDMLVQLVRRLPAMVTPRWVTTRCQPVAAADAVHALAAAVDVPQARGQVLEIGGPEVLTYQEMLVRVARLLNRRQLLVSLPVLTPRLSSLWLKLVTDADFLAARALIESMTNEVVVSDDSARLVLPEQPTSFDDAARAALDEAGISHS
jgi:uncharacterized protein YbjT (DUF2867 family)